MLLGSHVSMSGEKMLLGSVEEALSYQATTFMFYTGAPQNTRRKPVESMRREEAWQLMKENGINIAKVVVHAPYIINLANTIKPEVYDLAVTFLKQEIARCMALNMTTLVLHPGSHVKAGEEKGLKSIIKGLNEVLDEGQTTRIALETMAGKGSELGYTIDQLAFIISHVTQKELVGICLDTCHLHDAGYDVGHFDEILDEVEAKIGLDKVLAVHVNDSKNKRGARKDRHANIGKGEIGFEKLYEIVHNPRLENVPKILETPYIDKKPPYREEIAMLLEKR